MLGVSGQGNTRRVSCWCGNLRRLCHKANSLLECINAGLVQLFAKQQTCSTPLLAQWLAKLWEGGLRQVDSAPNGTLHTTPR
jgi:hypothetical protein